MSQTNQPLGSVLITGGCGFLGSHIVSLLLERSKTANIARISVLDLVTTRNRYPGVDYYDGDLTDAASVRRIFEKTRPDVIIHTASPEAFGSEEIQLKVNVGGTTTLLEESQRIGTVKAFVYTSSASVLSDARTDLVNGDERWSVITGQGEVYSDSKARAERLVLAANRPSMHQTFCTAAIRPAGIFGEGDVQFMNRVVWVARSGRTGTQFGTNENLFDCTYVDNVAHAHILATERLLEASADTTYDEKTRLADRAEFDAAAASNSGGKAVLPTWVDGEAFIITNQTPVYFWDFYRAIWFSYWRAVNALQAGDPRASEPSTRPLSKSPLFVPEPSSTPTVLPRGLSIVIATIVVWLFRIIRAKKAPLEPQMVIYATMTRYYRTTKAERLLGYQPIVSLEEGIKRGAAWFAKQDVDAANARMEKAD